ncbi:MAG: hypothetical protein LBO21_10785, partial [Synergistaceae bacterium]|nr:hypothetical protein [Synergistaceae bacterium]
MTYQMIIGKTAEIQNTCALKMAKWLEWCLPKVYDKQWWSKGVVERLSDEQCRRIDTSDSSNIHTLDLDVLLRVLSRNKNELRGRGFIHGMDISTIDKMFEVHNRWAHLSSELPALETVLRDLEVA